jgi:hypothetical protein
MMTCATPSTVLLNQERALHALVLLANFLEIALQKSFVA